MIYTQFLIGFLVYTLIAYISYDSVSKNSWWFFPLGIVASVIANVTWLYISKLEPNPSSLIIKGLWWDSMLTIIYLLVPILLFQAKLNYTQSVGLLLVVIGLFLTKV